MTEKDNASLIPFLEIFKRELLALAEALKTRFLKRSQLNDVFAFKIANPSEQAVIHEMVDDVAIQKGDELDTGLNGLEPVTNVDQASENTNGDGLGRARTLASRNFRNSDKEAA
ncbi:MAG: hypothetical protein PHS98_04040 [Bacilli bacterium]|nr:hypothetical protein [Bacilli bacterium]